MTWTTTTCGSTTPAPASGSPTAQPRMNRYPHRSSTTPPTSAERPPTVSWRSPSHGAAAGSPRRPDVRWPNAVDQVAVNAGAYDAALTNVTLGQPGALAGTPATSAGFNGTNSKMALPNNLVAGSTMSAGMWFKTTQAGGTLFSYQGVA